MTSLPKMQQRTFVAQDSRRRSLPVIADAPQPCGTAKSRARQALPAVDPSKEFGCVDWFLYPDATAAEAQAKVAAA
ncbi:MAG TPA: hypothetical protein VND24_01100 [Steroidobacteraceae bacterium]|nr:hypothetical protein [Steroidobacteraceae bacterium]